MSDGKIYITISDRRGQDNTPQPGVPGGDKSQKEDKNSLFSHWAKNKVIDEAKYLARQAVSFGVSNIGNFTGDFQAQRDVEAAMNILSNTTSIGTSIAAGFAIGNIPGAIISGVIATGNALINKGTNLYLESLNRKRQNRQIDILRERAGLNTLIDGSRGTEN